LDDKIIDELVEKITRAKSKEELKNLCPMGVFDIEDLGKGKIKSKVAD
jgi:hypothetical protein